MELSGLSPQIHLLKDFLYYFLKKKFRNSKNKNNPHPPKNSCFNIKETLILFSKPRKKFFLFKETDTLKSLLNVRK